MWLIFIFILVIILVILGLPRSDNIPDFVLTSENKTISEQVIDNFDNPTSSSSFNAEGGASDYYNWGLPDMTQPQKKQQKRHRCPSCENTFIDYDYCPIDIDEKNGCKKCDITNHPQIGKYVLKSSVPPCPDMSNYAKKSELCPCKDMSKYILKSKIPPPKQCPDLSKYILKSKIPSCPSQPLCPRCPICPTCPKYRTMKDYMDEGNNVFNDYISKDYIKKDQCGRYLEENQPAKFKEKCGKIMNREYDNNKNHYKDNNYGGNEFC